MKHRIHTMLKFYGDALYISQVLTYCAAIRSAVFWKLHGSYVRGKSENLKVPGCERTVVRRLFFCFFARRLYVHPLLNLFHRLCF